MEKIKVCPFGIVTSISLPLGSLGHFVSWRK